MIRQKQEPIIFELDRFTAAMKESIDRIAKNVIALHRINNLLAGDFVPISKNLKVKDLEIVSDYLRHMGETLRNPNRIPGKSGIGN